MCGIFGIIVEKNADVNQKAFRKILKHIFLLSESRGKESSGLLFIENEHTEICKSSGKARRLIRSINYKNKIDNYLSRLFTNEDLSKNASIIGNTRLATNGSHMDENNNQPFTIETISGVHNGIVVNCEELMNKHGILSRKGESDSEILFRVFQKYSDYGESMDSAAEKLLAEIEGSASVAVYNAINSELLLTTNTGSLYILSSKDMPGLLIFASEKPILRKLISKSLILKKLESIMIEQVAPGKGVVIDIKSFKRREFNTATPPNKKPPKKKSSKSYFEDLLNKCRGGPKGIPELKRCSKCILPETIPNIKFDTYGVCNYCNNHKTIRYSGEAELKIILDKYRNNSGEPDCIVAFSGGRDSAYALHYIKKVMGMNPLAFTYDWGMVDDIARRNQARMVGKLGVEHIIIASDIEKKRIHIRKNILAWLKKPHLGMVVLFMAGDKPAEYWVSKVAKKHNIKLVILCRGNELENTDFKWGLLGLDCGEPGGVMHHMPLMGRVKFTCSCLWQYIRNPRYFNSAAPEILFDYLTTYAIRYDFLYLWHYLKWDEAEVVQTLKDYYSWECSEDTIQTWRTDDGTSPFYNYIYYTVGGFTENDCFRSNQVREGIINRETALRLVNEENRVRYQAIKKYLNRVGLSYSYVMDEIRRIPRFYEQ